MVWAAVLIAALLTVPASINIHDTNIALAQAQAEKERAEFAVMREKNKSCDWYDYYADQKSLDEGNPCSYQDYWSEPKYNYSPR